MVDHEKALVEATREALGLWSAYRVYPDQNYAALCRAMRALGKASEAYEVEEFPSECPVTGGVAHE
jgi:hypothetical protein